MRFVEVETPAAVAVRPVAAVRLRRAVPLRGRLPAGRAPGRRRCPWTRRCSPSCSASRATAAARAARPRRRRRPSRRDLQRLSDDRRARDVEGVADLLRRARPAEHRRGRRARCDAGLAGRARGGPAAIRVRVAGEERWAAVEDAGRLRDALGAPLPVGIPEAFLEPVRDPLGDLVARYARTHVPVPPRDVAARFGLGPAVVEQALARLAGAGRVVEGEFLPGGAGHRVVRRRGAAHAAPPVAGRAAQGGRAGARSRRWRRSCRAWQQVGGRLRGAAGVLRVVEQLQGAAGPGVGPGVAGAAGRGCRATPPRCSTSCAPPARCSGAGTGRCPAPTAGCRCTCADTAHLTLPAPDPSRRGHAAAPGGARRAGRRRRVLLPPALRRGRGSTDDADAGRGAVGPRLVRARHQRHPRAAAHAVGGGGAAPAAAADPARAATAAARPAMPSRTGPPVAAGRWSLLPEVEADPTRRAPRRWPRCCSTGTAS